MTAAVLDALPSLEDDVLKHRGLIRQLRNAGGVYNGRLANQLEGCSLRRRCRSGACILCGRELQLAIFELIVQQIREPARRTMRGRMTAVTIIPAEGIVAPEALTVESCWHAMEAIARAIATAGLSPVVAGVDVAFSEDEKGEFEPHWALHSHVVIPNWAPEQQKKVLRAAVTRSALVKVRVQFDRLDDRANGRLYSVKPDRVRKVSYLDDTQVSSGRAPFRNTHRRELRPWQAVRLAQVEHEIGLLNRVLIKGIATETVEAALQGFYWPQDGP